jgi:hypothetical protein
VPSALRGGLRTERGRRHTECACYIGPSRRAKIANVRFLPMNFSITCGEALEFRECAIGRAIGTPERPLAATNVAGTLRVPSALRGGLRTERGRRHTECACYIEPSRRAKIANVRFLPMNFSITCGEVLEFRECAIGRAIGTPERPLAATNVAGTLRVPSALRGGLRKERGRRHTECACYIGPSRRAKIANVRFLPMNFSITCGEVLELRESAIGRAIGTPERPWAATNVAGTLRVPSALRGGLRKERASRHTECGCYH